MKAGIEERTETNLVNLRRVIYLTIMNALNYEEAMYKLLKIEIQEGQDSGEDYTSSLTPIADRKVIKKNVLP